MAEGGNKRWVPREFFDLKSISYLKSNIIKAQHLRTMATFVKVNAPMPEVASDRTHRCLENKGMNIECGEGCTDPSCDNKCIGSGVKKNTYICVTKEKGYGLFANETIHPGDFIVEYIGVVKSIKEEKTAYSIEIPEINLQIDPAKHGNEAMMMNHSCSPNAQVERWIVGKQLRMGVFAIKKIEQNQEITFDYREDYSFKWACKCESKNCRGSIGKQAQEVLQQLPIPQTDSKQTAQTVQQDRVKRSFNQEPSTSEPKQPNLPSPQHQPTSTSPSTSSSSFENENDSFIDSLPLDPSKDPVFVCKSCNVSFGTQYELSRHLKTSSAHNTPTLPCPYAKNGCKKLFTRSDSLSLHVKSCKFVSVNYVLSLADDSENDPNDIRPRCLYCNEPFASTGNRNNHMRFCVKKPRDTV